MKRLFVLIVLVMTMVFLSASGAFAWHFEIENTNEDNIFDVWFKTDSEVELNAYTLVFDYNKEKLDWASDGVGDAGVDYTHTPPSPLFALGVPTDYPHTTPVPDSGTITNYSALIFGPDGAIISSDYHLGTLIFDVGGTEPADLKWATWPTDLVVTVNDTLYEHTDLYVPSSNPSAFAPVPIPGTVLLLGSGLLGLFGIRRKRNGA